MRGVRLALAFVLAASPSLADRIVPSSARSVGGNGAFFKTDLRLLNTSATDGATVVATFTPKGGAPITGPELKIPPRQQLAFDDVLGLLFGQTADTSGPIRIAAPDAVEASSRTYNANDACTSGTLGTWVPGLRPSAAITSGLIAQAAGSGDRTSGFRTNLILTNPSLLEAATVKVALWTGDGTPIGSLATARVEPGQVFQSEVFALVGAPEVTAANAFVSFTSDRPVLALTTVVDNRSNDSAAYLAVAADPPPATLVEVGDVSTFAGSYGVSGKATVVTARALRAAEFRASGTAPGMDIRIGKSSGSRRDFRVLRVLGRQSFSGATLDLELPSDVDLNGFDTFTVWCYEFNVIIAEGRFQKP